jgi:hypothetical protein
MQADSGYGNSHKSNYVFAFRSLTKCQNYNSLVYKWSPPIVRLLTFPLLGNFFQYLSLLRVSL